ncbi:MAG: tail protein X [Psychrosphaera sp.]|nr:tail protein X [Psychrosphaera sp.]
MSDATYRTRDGDMLDQICWLHYDQQSGQQSGAVEQVLEKNPGLAALGPVYPENLLITLPQIVRTVVSQTVQIWD